MIEAFVTNAGKYGEGVLCGEWLKLPTTQKDVQKLLAKIGVDGVLYEEFFISDYRTEVAGLRLGEHESIDELNYFAALLGDLDEYDMKKFEAAVAYGVHSGDVAGLINLAQNMDCYVLNPDVTTEEELGHYLIDELNLLDVPEKLVDYFDYEAYGRDAHINGGRLTDNGYIENCGGLVEHYGGREDIPDDYRVFAYPGERLPIRDQLAMYGVMMPAPSADHRPVPERSTR